MAMERVVQAPQLWRVQIWVPDETELNKVSGNADHFDCMQSVHGDLHLHARRNDLAWLVRADTGVEYLRVDGSKGSFFPDVLVAHNVSIPATEQYDITVVGKPPELVIEILSPSTAGEDRGDKMTAYAQMGVGEYLVFDPRPRDRPLLAGYRLVGWGEYAPIPFAWGGGVWLTSLGLRVVAESANYETGHGPLLRFYTEAGEPLPHVDEEAQARLHTERALARAEQERSTAEQERDAAQAKLVRLQALLASHGIDSEA